MAYATNTIVSPEKSQAEIQATLRRYGADAFGVMERRGMASVVFEFNRLQIRIDVTLPARDSDEFCLTETGRERNENQQEKAFEQAVRSRWRALLLAIKAKLEAVEVGISTIEVEFMPFVVMGDGRALHEHIMPRLEAATKTGKLPKMLPMEA